MYKNRAGQKSIVYAWDKTTGLPKTGDAGNITSYISKDGGAASASDDTNPTEIDATNLKGYYAFDLLQAETNCDLFLQAPVSATSDIIVFPVILYTVRGSIAGPFRNIASQKLGIFAYDLTTNIGKDGDAGNITCYYSLDGAAASQTNDVNPTEVDATNMKGFYLFDLTQAETNATVGVFKAESGTADIVASPVDVRFRPVSAGGFGVLF